MAFLADLSGRRDVAARAAEQVQAAAGEMPVYTHRYRLPGLVLQQDLGGAAQGRAVGCRSGGAGEILQRHGAASAHQRHPQVPRRRADQARDRLAPAGTAVVAGSPAGNGTEFLRSLVVLAPSLASIMVALFWGISISYARASIRISPPPSSPEEEDSRESDFGFETWGRSLGKWNRRIP